MSASAQNPAKPAADQHDQIGRLDVVDEFWIGADAEIAGIVGMELVEKLGAPEAGRDRHREALGKTRE